MYLFVLIGNVLNFHKICEYSHVSYGEIVFSRINFVHKNPECCFVVYSSS